MGNKKKKGKKSKGHKVKTDSKQQISSSEAGPRAESRPVKSGPKIKKVLISFSFLLVLVLTVIVIRGKILNKETSEISYDWNVLLITLDTTRADRLGCYGYQVGSTPNLDELAAAGVRFKKAYCQVPLTLPSHASILTGLNPYRHGVHNNGNYALRPEFITLAEILKEENFQTAAFVASFSVDSRFGLDQGFDVYDDVFEPRAAFKSPNAERKADEVYLSFAQWFEKNYRDRFLAWIHFFDPHYPYNPPIEYARKFPKELYDGEVAFMDYYVGRVIELLKIYGIYDRTMIIIVGDHGEAFGEKVEQGHGIFLYEMSVRVPLIILAPGLPAGLVVEPEVQLIDLVPTILDFLGLKSPQMFEGQSLRPVMAGKRFRQVDIYLETFYPKENYGWSELTGLVSGEWKYLQAPKPELYNLKDDPQENNNLFAIKEDKAQQLKIRLENLIKQGLGAVSSKRQMTAEEQERLRSLGYLQLAGNQKAGFLPDPKDKLEELEYYQKAYDFETKGNLEAAEEAFAQLLKIAPYLESSYINLARIQGNRKNYQAALETLQKGLEEIPSSDHLLSKLGQTYFLIDRKSEALEAMDKALLVNPNNYEALVVSAMIRESAGQPDEALKFIERALFIEPENEFLRLAKAENLVRCNRLKEASEIYDRLTIDFPTNDFYALNSAVVHNLLKEYDRSIEILEKLVVRQPSPKAYLNLAIAYLETRQLPEAVRALEFYLSDTRGEDPENIAEAKAQLARLKNLVK